MILDYLTEARTVLDAHASTAEEAITLAVQLLVDAGQVSAQYLQDVLADFRRDGPFCVLAPGFAVPHSQPRATVYESGISLVRLSQPVAFGHASYDPVRFVVALAGVDQNAHIILLQQLIPLLASAELTARLEQVDSYKELTELLKSV